MRNERPKFGVKEAALMGLAALNLGGGDSRASDAKPPESPKMETFTPKKGNAEGLEPGVTAHHSTSWDYNYQDPGDVERARALREQIEAEKNK
jgi:hypothetical protein